MAVTHVTNANTVVVRSYGDFIHDEGLLNAQTATAYPGTVVRVVAGTVTPVDGTASAAIGAWGILAEQEGLGGTMRTAYLAGEHARVWKPRKGDQFRAFLAQNAQAVAGYAAGDLFKCGADGIFAPYASAVPTAGELADGLLAHGTLAVTTNTAKFKTTTTSYIRLSSIQYADPATDDLVFTENYTINTGAAEGKLYGAFLVQVNAAGTISTLAKAADQAYATSALAIANLPAAATGNIAIGYIVVQAKEATAWTANTDDLVAASDCETVSFVNGTPITPAFTVAAADIAPVVVELVTALPTDNLKSATLADRVVIFEVL
jgi:hypothetical protein